MTQPRSRVDLYAAIRRDARSGMSNRALQRKHGVGFRTVTAALESAWPKERKQPPKRGSRLDAYRVVIDDWLRSDLDAPRKQRHTAKRIFDRLLDEHDGAGVVSYWMVREYVATRRREIRVEVGREPANAFIPQEHLPGREAEVDFGDVAIRLRGELVTCALFSLRLSYSGKAVHRVSASAGQEAFFEGHVHAFNVLGGVPTGKIRYDNLKAAVASVIGFSRQRVEADRWTAVRSHYGIEAFYCQPGIQGAREGRRRGADRLVPTQPPRPHPRSRLPRRAQRYGRRLGRSRRRPADRVPRPHGRGTLRHRAATPRAPSDRAVRDRPLVHPRVDRYAQVTVRMNKYSVPARMVGRQARVLLNASDLVVFDGRTEIARHERLMTKGSTRVDLDHYLEVLLRKPGALPGAKALEQARASGRFTPVHDAWWAAACKAHGDADGTRALIEVLMLHRHLPHDHVVAGLATALRAGALTADAVALEARKYNDTADGGADDTTADHQSLMSGDRARGEGEIPAVRSLTERRLRAHIPADTRPLPSVEKYDQLLASRRDTPNEGAAP